MALSPGMGSGGVRTSSPLSASSFTVPRHHHVPDHDDFPTSSSPPRSGDGGSTPRHHRAHPHGSLLQHSPEGLLRWCNEVLCARGQPTLSSLHADVPDGTSLVRLAEALSGRRMKSTVPDPSSRQARIHNIRLALSIFSDEGVPCQSISSSDLEEGHVESVIKLIKAIVECYSQQQQHSTSTPVKEKKERRSSGRTEVESAAKAQLMSKLREFLSSSNSASTSSNSSLSSSTSVDVPSDGSGSKKSKGRIGRSLSFRRFTGSSGKAALRVSDENASKRMNRSQSLSRDSLPPPQATSSTSSSPLAAFPPSSPSTIHRTDRDRPDVSDEDFTPRGEYPNPSQQPEQRSRQNSMVHQRERRSSSTGSTGSGSSSCRGSFSRTNSISEASLEELGQDGIPESDGGSKREGRKKKKEKQGKGKGKDKTPKKSKKKRAEKETEAKGSKKRGGRGSELRRSVSWYKGGKQLDRIGLVEENKGSPSARTSAPKQQKSRSLRNLFQILNFSQEVKTQAHVTKQPSHGSVTDRTRRSPSVEKRASEASSSGSQSLRTSDSSSLSGSVPPSPSAARHHSESVISTLDLKSSSTSECKDIRLTMSAEDLRGSSGGWNTNNFSRPCSSRRDQLKIDASQLENEDAAHKRFKEDDHDDEEGDVDDSEEDVEKSEMVQNEETRNVTTTQRRRKKERKACFKEEKEEEIEENSTMKVKKKKKKRRKSEVILEKRLASLERLRNLVELLNDFLAGHPILPTLGPAFSEPIPMTAETSETEARDVVWRVDTVSVMTRVMEVMQQARAIFHSCPDEVQRADILFMARQLNSSALRLVDILDTHPDYNALCAFVQHRIELTAAGLELVVVCGLPDEWMRAYTDESVLSDYESLSVPS